MNPRHWWNMVTGAGQQPAAGPVPVSPAPSTLGQAPAEGRREAALDQLDPIMTRADPDLIAAAIAYVRGKHGDDETRLLWARYAYTGARVLWGPASRPALLISRDYQRVLAEQGLTGDAVTVCTDRLRYQRLTRPDLVLRTRLCLAEALHADGQCDRARREIAETRRSGHHHQLAACLLGQQIVLSQAAIMAGCGLTLRAVQILHRNAGLIADLDPMARGLAADWLTAAETTHPPVCQRDSPPMAADGRRGFWLLTLDALTANTRGGKGEQCSTAALRRDRRQGAIDLRQEKATHPAVTPRDTGRRQPRPPGDDRWYGYGLLESWPNAQWERPR